MNSCKNIITTGFRRYSTVKRKYPINTNEIKEMPIYQYIVSPHQRHRVYVWGNVRTGALGVPYLKKQQDANPIEFVQCPKRLSFGEKFKVTTACSGFGFTVFAVDGETDKIYGTGLNSDGQIGHHEINKGKPLNIIFFPQPVTLPFQRDDVKVLKLSAGRAHLAVLTDDGLFLLGNNSYGQCGREIISDENYLQTEYVNHIKEIDGKNIIDIECGQDHTMVILDDGSVYSSGWGADGQTGLGHYNVASSFSKIMGDISKEKIIKLSCRSDFVLALNTEGDVFGWGNTEYAQITTSDNSQQVSNPIHIKMVSGLGKIKDVAAGGSFCSVLNENHEVSVWGYGLLGTGPAVQESRTPITIPSTLFGQNDFNSDTLVQNIYCGLSHFAAVTNKGDLYTWGRNRFHSLGLGQKTDQYFPLRVSLGANVKQVFCGLDHTVALCDSYMSDSKN